MVHDPVNHPECSFLLPAEIPIDISICGDETVSLTTPGTISHDLEFGVDSDFSYTYADLVAMFQISNHCNISSIEVSKINMVSPSTAGAPWASWIALDGNNDLQIQFNANVNQNVTYNVSVWLTTTGGVQQEKQFDFFFFSRNIPPTLNPPAIEDIELILVQEDQLRNLISDWEWTSQEAVDVEGNTISFELVGQLPCNCLSLELYNVNKFKLKVQVYELTEDDGGTHNFSVIVKDDGSARTTTYPMQFTVLWMKYDNPAP